MGYTPIMDDVGGGPARRALGGENSMAPSACAPAEWSVCKFSTAAVVPSVNMHAPIHAIMLDSYVQYLPAAKSTKTSRGRSNAAAEVPEAMATTAS